MRDAVRDGGRAPTLSMFSVADHHPIRHPGRERSVRQLYGELMAQVELADRLGYDTFFVAEHHFHEYGVIPNPAAFLAAAALRTARIRLAPAVAVLPFHDTRRLAEDYAMVDQLSAGRLVMGVGSGYLSHEFAGFGIDPAGKRERFDEALAVLKRLWSGERVSFEGAFHRLDGVALNVLPHAGLPPFYVASLRKEVAYHVGRNGANMMTVPYASLDRFEEIGPMLEEFRRGHAECPPVDGARPGGDTLVALHTYVADTAEEARAHASRAFDLYVETRLYAKRQSYDDIMRSGLSLMGSVEEVADKMVALHRMGCRHLMLLQNFGGLDAALVERSMTKAMNEVLPLVERRLA